MSDLDERDQDGLLTPWALACDALRDAGCDCGEDEEGTCLGCRCEAAMRAERARAEKAEAEIAALKAMLDAQSNGVLGTIDDTLARLFAPRRAPRCPECGSEATEVQYYSEDDYYLVYCLECVTEGEHAPTIDAALDAWRPQP